MTCGCPASLVLEHNELDLVNYTGVSVGYGWASATNAMSHNKIDYNDIHDVCEILADCGSLYTLSNQAPGLEMLNAYCHDFSQSPWANDSINNIYMDEGTDGYTVEHNVVINAPTVVWQHANGTNLTIENNGSNPRNPSRSPRYRGTAGSPPSVPVGPRWDVGRIGEI